MWILILCCIALVPQVFSEGDETLWRGNGQFVLANNPVNSYNEPNPQIRVGRMQPQQNYYSPYVNSLANDGMMASEAILLITFRILKIKILMSSFLFSCLFLDAPGGLHGHRHLGRSFGIHGYHPLGGGLGIHGHRHHGRGGGLHGDSLGIHGYQ